MLPVDPDFASQVGRQISDMTSKSEQLQDMINQLLVGDMEPLTELEKLCDGQMRWNVACLQRKMEKLQTACKQLACVAQKRKYVEADVAMLPSLCRGHALREDAPAQQGVTHAGGSTRGMLALPPGTEIHWQKVLIRNGRNMQPEPTLAEDGIELRTIRSQVSDWADQCHADKLWCQDAVRIMQEATGAKQVILIHDPLHRDGSDKFKGYGVGAHTDYSAYCEKNLPVNIQQECHGKHFALFNLWRSTDVHSVKWFPLGFLHPASVCPSDLVYCEQYGEALFKDLVEADLQSSHLGLHCDAMLVDGIRYSTYRAVAAHKGLVPDRRKKDPNIVFRHVHSKRHSWLYFPDMTQDEVVIFRQYDTRIAEVAKSTVVHAAFADPSVHAEVLRRHSCELRCVCIFDEQRPDEEACKKQRLKLIEDAFSGLPSPAASPSTPEWLATQSRFVRDGLEALLRGAVMQPICFGRELLDLWDQGLRGVEICRALESLLECDRQVGDPERLLKQQTDGTSAPEGDNPFRELPHMAIILSSHKFCIWV